MNRIDRVRLLCDNYRERLENLELVKAKPYGNQRTQVIAISDLHVPFCREDLLKKIIRKHSGAEVCVVTGDLFDANLISTFTKHKEIPFAIEYAAAFEIVCLLSKHFGHVILVDGNHDAGRYQRELGKLNPTIRFLVKESPLKYIADGLQVSPSGESLGNISLPNVTYAGDVNSQSWWCKVGQCLFVHRLKGFAKAPMANAVKANEWFLGRGTEFQAVVNGHSHHVGQIIHRGKIVIDQGCLCFPMDYEADGRLTMHPQDLGYAIVELDKRGNVDPEGTRVVHLGTYQTL